MRVIILLINKMPDHKINIYAALGKWHTSIGILVRYKSIYYYKATSLIQPSTPAYVLQEI